MTHVVRPSDACPNCGCAYCRGVAAGRDGRGQSADGAYTYSVERFETLGRTVEWYAVERSTYAGCMRVRCPSRFTARQKCERWRENRDAMARQAEVDRG